MKIFPLNRRVLVVSVSLLLVVVMSAACMPVQPVTAVQAQAAQPGDTESAPDIEAIWAEYADSLMAGDAERWIQLWMEDGVQMPPDAPPNVGRETILAGLEGELAMGAYGDFAIHNEDLMVDGDLAVARGMYSGTYVPNDGSAPISFEGKYMTVLKRQPDGGWKLYRDIFNSNVPAR